MSQTDLSRWSSANTISAEADGSPPPPERREPHALQVSASEAPASPRRDEGAGQWPLASELALVGVTVAAALGLARVFSDGSFVLPVLIAAVFSHVAASMTRHLGMRPTVAGLFSALAVLLITAWVVEPGTTTWGLPLEGTWQALGSDLHEAWARFSDVRAPTVAIPGFVAAAACGAGLAGALADGLAFRARARFEALAPTFTLFMFGALLGSDDFRLASAGLYFGAVIVFLVVSSPSRTQPWFNGRSRQGDVALLRAGLGTGAAALLVGIVLGPQLPGAHTLGVVGLGDDSAKGSSSRVTVSPLVDIRSRLVNQSDTAMFSVQSDTPSYWRLTALGRFDGSIWSSLGSYQPIDGSLESTGPDRGTRVVPQRFSITGLASIWLPAAYRPERFEGPEGIRFDRDSSSLLTDAESSDGLTYVVSSSQPLLSAEHLASAPPVTSADLNRRYLPLPPEFPARVAELAAEVTAGEPLPYGKAKALQDWFRSDFTYDLDVPPGHDASAIERFLFVTRRGYCEQFAGSYAAMARTLGIPARVAVGFTAGDDAGDGTFEVTGKQAHAWPEIFLAGVGWVAFEPTPGRAIPNADSYTGVRPPRADGDPAPSPPTTVPAAQAQAPTTQAAPTDSSPAPDTVPNPSTEGGGGLPVLALVVALVALLAVAYVVMVPVARRRRQTLLRHAAATPTDQVFLAWREANEDLGLAGVRKRPSETAHEFARRVGADSQDVAAAMTELAGQWTTASYSPEGVSQDQAATAELAAARLRANLTARATRMQRVLWQLDPRPLLGRRWA